MSGIFVGADGGHWFARFWSLVLPPRLTLWVLGGLVLIFWMGVFFLVFGVLLRRCWFLVLPQRLTLWLLGGLVLIPRVQQPATSNQRLATSNQLIS